MSFQASKKHWLIPAHANCRHEVLKTFGSGDELWRLPVSQQAKKKDPELPEFYDVRAITKTLPNGTTKTILTSLVDENLWPGAEVFDLYRERWEIELAYGEIKTDLQRQATTLRSQTPDGIAQEFWATLLMYNLVRLEITKIAAEAKVEPCRIIFMTALRFIIDEWIFSTNAAPGSIPKKLDAMRKEIARFMLPKRRSKRAYPREVKFLQHKYPKRKMPPSVLN